MGNYQVVSRGIYPYPQKDPLLTVQSFVYFVENGRKYLLLKWRNERDAFLTGLELTLSFFDAAGNCLGSEKRSFSPLRFGPHSSFVLEPKTEVSEDCVEFRVDLITARYGNYIYSAGREGVTADYAPETVPENIGRRREGKSASVKSYGVSVSRPAFPYWTGLVLCALLGILIGLTCWRVDEFKENSRKILKDGVEYAIIDSGESEELYVTGYRGKGENVVIPESIGDYPVTRIADRAFSGSDSITRVTLEGSPEIGVEAFSHCRNLTDINLTHVKVIGELAFLNCEKLKSVTADRLERLGDRAFFQCRALESVSIRNAEKTLKLGIQPFFYCGNLKSVRIDQTTEYSYNTSLFLGVSELQTLELKNFPSFSVGQGAGMLFSMFGDTYVSLKSLKIGQIDFIPDRFCEGVEVERVEIGSMAQPVIGEAAFQGCYTLRKITLPDVERIEAYAFSGCQALESFKMSTALKHIGEYAFAECMSLTSLTIPSSVETIGASAFISCYRVATLTLPFLGTSRDSEGRLSDIFGGKSPYFIKTVTLTDPLLTIKSFAFSNCLQMEKIVLPETVVSIEDYAFAYCNKLSSVELPENLTSIGENAFNECYSLTEITLPQSLTNIGDNAFQFCYRLYEVRNESSLDLSVSGGQVTEHALKVYAPGEEEVPKAETQGFRFARFGNDWYMIGYPKNRTDLTLPEFFRYGGTVNRYRVADYLFQSDNTLFSVSIPSSVEELGKSAFEGCGNLQTVRFEADSSLTVIRSGSFRSCVALTSVALPEALQTIEASAFGDCFSLAGIVLPKKLSRIDSDAFLNCENLKTVYNLSGLNLEKGSKSHGCVAYYAENIYPSLNI